MSKQFINEVNRMKSLFDYKRGKVISEQKIIVIEEFNYNSYPCINPNWSKGTEENNGRLMSYVQGQGTDDFVVNSLHYTLDAVKFFEDGSYKIGNMSGKYSCGTNGSIVIDGTTVQKSTTSQSNTTTTSSSQKSKYLAPLELRKNVGNKSGVQAFQDWLDSKNPGWHLKYGKLNSEPSKGYGTFGPNTSDAWTKFKKAYLTEFPQLENVASPIPLSNDTSATAPAAAIAPGTATTPEVALPTIKTPINPTANTTTPAEFYKTLYNSKLIQGGGEDGADKIRYKAPRGQKTPLLTKDQQDLLTKHMDTLGYDFYRKGNDNRLVYTKR